MYYNKKSKTFSKIHSCKKRNLWLILETLRIDLIAYMYKRLELKLRSKLYFFPSQIALIFCVTTSLSESSLRLILAIILEFFNYIISSNLEDMYETTLVFRRYCLKLLNTSPLLQQSPNSIYKVSKMRRKVLLALCM